MIRLLANLGYGSLREVEKMIRTGAVTDAEGNVLNDKARPSPDDVRVHGDPLDPPAPLVVVMQKPMGVTCSHDDPGGLVFELLPPRFIRRNPPLSCVGRLDKETSGLLLFTDDGQLLHRISIGLLVLPEDLAPGEWRVATDAEVQLCGVA